MMTLTRKLPRFQAARLSAWAALVTLLAGCSTPATRVVLLPQGDGRPSAVVVSAKGVEGSEVTLSAPYQRATAALGATAPPRIDQADAARVQAENRALFDMAPPPAQRSTLYFEPGGTVLTAESQQMLNEVLAAALARSGGDMVVTGHTDTRGTAEQNDDLSQRRAQQVRQMLVERQFPAARIEAVGRGEREPAVPTADEVDEPRNRRVSIEVR